MTETMLVRYGLLWEFNEYTFVSHGMYGGELDSPLCSCDHLLVISNTLVVVGVIV